jgi:hypothetical protein
MVDFSLETAGGGRPPQGESEYPTRVSLSRINGRYEQAAPDRAMSRRVLFSEQYEIGIGTWKATIVRQIDSRAGKVRFRTDFDPQGRQSWQRRRMERLSQRLNARRRSSD